MLKKGFLASTNFYASIAHSEDDFTSYLDALDEVYNTISQCEKDNKSILDITSFKSSRATSIHKNL